MDNFRSKVLTFCVVTILLLFITSYYSQVLVAFFPNFNKINIVSDITNYETSGFKKTVSNKVRLTNKDSVYVNTLQEYDAIENDIIGFDQYNNEAVLSSFQEKIVALSAQKKGKIRIAWFGDSTIECDLITQQLRVLFNKYYDTDTGVGFLPINTATSNLRKTGLIEVVGEFETLNFKQNARNLYLSGYSYEATDFDITATNKVKRRGDIHLNKWLYCGKADSIQIQIAEKTKVFYPTEKFNKILLDSSLSNSIHFKIVNNTAPIFGVSMEPENGIVIDNYSFRGITGVELRKLENQLLDQINANATYDLIVFQYGVNLLSSPELTNFDNYYAKMNRVIQKIKNHLNKSEFLIIGSGDRAFKYEGEWKTAIGMDSLVKVQAKLAYNNKIPFLNLYKSMGGEGTIVKWVDANPSFASKDHIHFTYKGANKVANIIFNSFINDYNKLKNKPTNAKQ